MIEKQALSRIKWESIRLPDYFLIEVDLPSKNTAVYAIDSTLGKSDRDTYTTCSTSIGNKTGRYSRSQTIPTILRRIGSEEKRDERMLIYGESTCGEFALFEKYTARKRD